MSARPRRDPAAPSLPPPSWATDAAGVGCRLFRGGRFAHRTNQIAVQSARLGIDGAAVSTAP